MSAQHGKPERLFISNENSDRHYQYQSDIDDVRAFG
jgi:hypothetical protein